MSLFPSASDQSVWGFWAQVTVTRLQGLRRDVSIKALLQRDARKTLYA